MNKMLEVVLPEHDEERRSHICPACDGMMVPCVVSEIFSFKSMKIRVSNIMAYKCTECGMEVYSSAEAEMIENAINDAVKERL